MCVCVGGVQGWGEEGDEDGRQTPKRQRDRQTARGNGYTVKERRAQIQVRNRGSKKRTG